MTRWATIDKRKLEMEVAKLAAELRTQLGGRETVTGYKQCLEFVRTEAEFNALSTVLDCIYTEGRTE